MGQRKIPIPVDEREIESIRQVLASALPVSPWPFCRAGDAVHLTGGPLRGLEGILLEVESDKRLLVSVSLLQRSVAVEIDEAWAVPADAETCPVEAPRYHHANKHSHEEAYARIH